MTGVDSTAFEAAATSSVVSTLTQVAGSGNVYTVTLSVAGSHGTLGLNLVDNGKIHDLAGNPLAPAASNASLQNQITFATAITPSIVTSADLTGDGKADLILVDSIDNLLSVQLGNSNGAVPEPDDVCDGFDAEFRGRWRTSMATASWIWSWPMRAVLIA